MDLAVCAALAAVFPLITITVVLEGRNVAARLRRGHRFLEHLVTSAVGIGAMGLVIVTIGLQTPLSNAFAAVAWGLFIVDVIVMLLFALLTAATYRPCEYGSGKRQPRPLRSLRVRPRANRLVSARRRRPAH